MSRVTINQLGSYLVDRERDVGSAPMPSIKHRPCEAYCNSQELAEGAKVLGLES
ncbi:predicted protein [Plenodomus lingam JN3]|uniref:Predicted protein n=1 Tax=Leptosphaeria maculans (strain JN3 / isolate v23.1.3 / race Av1-4-5-6-7-8) TaxID=985895 RepID=E5A3F0_LEPMJ|nr:predicted protein [Plenodomus lingam JN3]CBX98163.1 predicted protein [Plenodomus lingam JN3]